MKKLLTLLLLLAPSVLAQNPTSGGPIPQTTYQTLPNNLGVPNGTTVSGSDITFPGSVKIKGGDPWVDVCATATCDGVTDDHVAIQTVLTAGGNIWFPSGTIVSSTALNVTCPSQIQGAYGKSFIKFTGATDGIVIGDAVACNNSSDSFIRGLTLLCANAACGKAINGDAPTNGITRFGLQDLSFTNDGNTAHNWAFNIHADNWQTSSWIRLASTSYLIGIHLQNSSNAIRVYDLELGAVQGNVANRGIETIDTGSFVDDSFYGGTIQGFTNQSAINVATPAHIDGLHVENTNGAPSDGADIVVGDSSHTITGPSFSNMQGGSYQIGVVGGLVYSASITQSATGNINITSAAVFPSLENVQYNNTLTDNCQNYTYMHNVQRLGADLFPLYLGYTPNFGSGGAKALTINGNLGNFLFGFAPSAPSYTSTVATGTAPFTVTSTTPVANLSLSGGAGTTVKTAAYSTNTNCSSSASPAVCGSAAAGSVAVPTGVTPTLVVNTTAVTANSQILFTPDESLGTKLSVTCNSTIAQVAIEPIVTARTAATSFTIQYNTTITVNPICLSYWIIN